MQKVQVKNKTITGLKTRTKNEDEMNPNTQKIAPLWQSFFSDVLPTLKEPNVPMYGIYTNYESDAMGEFDVLVGVESLETSSELTSVTLAEGKYLCFESKGEMPQAVIETWGEIWAYFSDKDCRDVRLYKTDFEKYISQDEAEIYIGIE